MLTVDWGTGHVTITWRLARHSTEITSYIVKYEINELSNTEVVPPDANSWRFNVSSRPSYTYSFSVLATVTANGTEIRGVNGTTIAGNIYMICAVHFNEIRLLWKLFAISSGCCSGWDNRWSFVPATSHCSIHCYNSSIYKEV